MILEFAKAMAAVTIILSIRFVIVLSWDHVFHRPPNENADDASEGTEPSADRVESSGSKSAGGLSSTGCSTHGCLGCMRAPDCGAEDIR